jgi:endonuclease V-like protein UPF0215 family
LKGQLRVLGIDDAPFRFKEGKVPIVGALVRSPSYLEAVLTAMVTVDGSDSDEVIIEMLSCSRYREQISLVMIDGVALGGFNVVDIRRLNRATGLPFSTITRDRPDMGAIETALQKHFTDWRDRFEVIAALPLHQVATKHSPLHITCAGISIDEVEGLIGQTTVQGAIPEPIRVAHLIATAMVRGESHGHA